VKPIQTAKGVARLLAPAPVRRALEARAYARAAPISPPALGGLRLRVPPGYEEHYGAGYELGMTGALARATAPGAHCADVGAHLGYFTLLMADRAGTTGRVTAFEASPPNAAAVRSTVALNGLEGRVDVVPAAVGAEHGGRIVLFSGRRGGDMEWSTSTDFVERERVDARRGDVRVDAVSLDGHFGDEPLDVLKVDVEGAEGDVLRGARRVLREQRPVVVLEFHRPVGWPAIGELLDAGYALESLDGEPLGPFAGPDEVPYHLVARPPA
jgi:FkbM family methyltransferase